MKKENKRTERSAAGAKVRGMVQTALFAAVIFIMAFTPFLGYIPLGFTRVTTIHIPVILGSLMLGPGKGALLGGIFGLTSFINNTVNPTATSFVFSPFYSLGEFSGGPASLLICFVPRILVGVIPWCIYKLVKKCSKKEGTSGAGLILAGIDKIFGIARHQHVNIRMLLLQRAGQICRLVCRNAPRHSQQDRFSLQHRRSASSPNIFFISW